MQLTPSGPPLARTASRPGALGTERTRLGAVSLQVADLDTTAVPQVLANLAKALSIRGTLALVGAAKPGTEAPFEVGASVVRGWTFKTIVQGSSVPQRFIPRMVELWQQGRFPVDKLTKRYGLEEINKAFDDSKSGVTVKPVIVF